MGGIFSPSSGPASPPPPPPLPPSAIPPTLASSAVQQASGNQFARAKAAAGQTDKTSSQGDLTPAPTAKASLLGAT